jgi:small basic protein
MIIYNKNMNKNIMIIFQVIILVVFLCISAVIFSNISDNFSRFLVICVVAVFYSIWGIVHHRLLNTLNKAIIIEYFLVSFIVIMLFAIGMGVIRFL